MIIFKNKWKADAFKVILKKRWINLSTDELTEIGGDPEKLMSILQFDYGYPRKAAEREVKSFWASYSDAHV